MKVLNSLYMLVTLALAGIAFCAPPAPPSVARAEEGVKYLWNSVQAGNFHSELPQFDSSLNEAWQNYLSTKGVDKINEYL